MSMSEALKARLVGAAVLVGVAMMVLGSLLSGPKERAMPAEGVIVIRPEPERPPSLSERREAAKTREQISETNEVAMADRAADAAERQPESASSDRSAASPEPARSADGRSGGSEPIAVAPAKVEPKPVERIPAPVRKPASQPTPAPPTSSEPKPGPASNDLYARIAGTADPSPRRDRTASQPTPSAASRPTPKPQPAAAPDNGWVIRVASFGDADNAERMVQRTRAAGFNTTTEAVTVANRTYTRVQVGPYASERDAKAAQRELQAKVGETGQLIPPRS